jgi:hypothetical protein
MTREGLEQAESAPKEALSACWVRSRIGLRARPQQQPPPPLLADGTD